MLKFARTGFIASFIDWKGQKNKNISPGQEKQYCYRKKREYFKMQNDSPLMLKANV